MPLIFKAMRLTGLLLFVVMLSGCASEQGSKAPATPGGSYKVGQPYQINGIWYYPQENYSYDETGIASWYGAEFEGKARTANGEIFNKDELTAAHKTLQLPSLARVTNLENGKSVVVRINDRGPFSGARIIDVSQRAAQLLEFDKKGTAKVRVQVLADESKAIADALRHYGSASPDGNGSVVPPVAASPSGAVTSQSLPPLAGASVSSAPLTSTALTSPSSGPKLTLQNVKPVAEAHQLAVSGPNQIYVQGGAFTSMENAQKLQQQLAKFGDARVSETLVKGIKYYRVRIGPMPDVPKADSMLKKVSHAGVDGARIVVE